MSKAAKTLRLYFPMPGEPDQKLDILLHRVDSEISVCLGDSLALLYRMASMGRIWYLPSLDAYAFRVTTRLHDGSFKELWLMFRDLFVWDGSVVVRSQRWVEKCEPRRSNLTAAQYFEALMGYFISQLYDHDPRWKALDLPPLEIMLYVFAQEPFCQMISRLVYTYEGPDNPKDRTAANTSIGKVKIEYPDGSFYDVTPEQVVISNTTCVEVGDHLSGRTRIVTDWSIMGGTA